MAAHLRTELVVGALEMAVWNRQPSEGVIRHSDHGCQYTSLLFGERCQAVGIQCSMGSVGDCYDNAMAESFFATLECELLARQPFPTRLAARTALFEYRVHRSSSTTANGGIRRSAISRLTHLNGGGLSKHWLSPNTQLSTKPG